jgi:diguanylate cyclase (GGDEF)-like protein
MDDVAAVTLEPTTADMRAMHGALAAPPGPLGHVAELAQSLAAAQRVADVVRAAALAAGRALNAAFVSVARLDPEEGTVTVLIDSAGPAAQRSTPIPGSHRLSRHAFVRALVRGDGPWRYVAGQQKGRDPAEVLLSSAGASACMVTPIVVCGRVWGGLCATRSRGCAPFDDEDAEVATALAAVVGAGLTQVDRVETLALLAQTDAMTGLANRRGADEALDEALAAHRGTGTPVAVVLCDVNGLKRVNDTFGHPVGDLVLTRVSALLRAASAEIPGSTAARVGGDEFCLILPGVHLAHATELVERLSEASRSLPFGAGISCGVASADECAASGVRVTAKQLFRLADAAQYRAKRSGGVRVAVIGPEDILELAESSVAPAGTWVGVPPPHPSAGPDSMAACVTALVAALDRSNGASPLDRLTALADAAGTWLRAAGWAVSTVDPGADVLLTRSTSAVRESAGGLLVRKLARPGRTFPLDACALTAAAVRGHCFHVELDDETANPGALAMLAAAGYAGMVGAGSTDPATGTGWFIELYSDAFTRLPDGSDEAALAATLRALVALALHPGTV